MTWPTYRAPLRDDPEIGTEKLCRTCGDWWPLDDDFWGSQPYDSTRYAGTCYCGTAFQTRQPTQAYCSTACKDAAGYRRRHGKPAGSPATLEKIGTTTLRAWDSMCRACRVDLWSKAA